MTTLAGKVVFVTGASRGIGAVTTRILLEAGASVVAHFGRTGQGTEMLLETFGPDRMHPVHGDLARVGEATRLFQEAVAWKGRVDVLVNNAGIAPPLNIDAPLDKWSEVWAETLHVNLLSVAESCRAALLHYGEHGGGIIINIASRSAFRGDNPDAMHYAASKGAVITLTKSIARGFAGQGVLAYSVAPGWVKTEMAEAYLAEHAEELRRELPMGQAAPPEDVANTVVFLASGMVPHMTGATLDINGASYVR
ncbi:SDR family oxidoreductase [Deinococcus psychrotolerans]|uniref:SDR family oxidoreductase n=1 Tax=Deinococcus psychrotolerans TaxID=2489213 RepID=A0A3G8YSN9_9DEIO|nr:SDR family NAD(P)-dependent oxidoreductase [Deinococcus psychrotolerans]AZI44246.1 SDR family oxidoreductase [Deinococcus psychrotolerans]